jgi:phosphohistidine phosphatase
MRIFIVRHGIAEESAKGGDRARELSEEGRRKMKDAASGFARLDLQVDHIFSSPLVRAVQTAEILARAIDKGHSIEKMEELSPAHSPEEVLNRLRELKHAGNVMLAGHEPNCGELAAHLLGNAVVEFKKGAICLIETDSITAGNGILIWHLSPQALRLMAK